MGELIIAMMKYSISGEEPPKYEGLLAMAADFIFPQIDRSREYARLGSRGGIATSKKVYGTSKKEKTAEEPIENDTVIVDADDGGEEDFDGQCIITEEYVNEIESKKEFPLPEKDGKEAFADEGLYEKQMFENRFDKFWRNYPRKVERQRAYTVFKKLSPDDGLLRIMIDAIEEQKKTARWKKDDGQFIPYPANWLEGRRWEDEVEAVSDDLTELINSKKKDKQQYQSSSFETEDYFASALKRGDDFLNNN